MNRAQPPNHIPEQNVVDLRRIAAERRATEAPRKTFSLRRERAQKQSSPSLSQPAFRVQWSYFRREVFKFIAAAAVTSTFVFFGYQIVHAAQVARSAKDTAVVGATQLQDGFAALGALHVSDAHDAFRAANATFTSVDMMLNRQTGIPDWLLRSTPWVGKRYASGIALVATGKALAQVGDQLTNAVGDSKVEDLKPQVQTEGVISGTLGFLTPLMADPNVIDPILAEWKKGRAALHDVDPSILPTDYRKLFETWRDADQAILGSDQRLEDVVHVLTGLFAQDKPQEYLVLFENDDELRPTGGFAGTFLLMKFDHGTFKILDAPVTGPYDLTAQIPKTTLPPQPILSIAPYWTFQDANWFLDVPTSAKFMLDFYQQARGFRPDGVVFLTPAIVEQLLTITGPVRPDGYGIDITSDNFVSATELQVEFGFDRALNNPKEFLIDLVPVLFQRLATLGPVEATSAFASTMQALTQANVLLYSEDADLETILDRLGWSGRILPSTQDYLAVIDTNLGGGKTDRTIETSVKVDATIQAETVRHVVTVTRTHTGKRSDPLHGQTNRDFLRVYVPSQAQFVSITGGSQPPDDMFYDPVETALPSEKLKQVEGSIFVDGGNQYRLTEESGLRVYGAWSLLEPGQSQTINFTYTTPLSGDTWQLVWQKQPGAQNRDWTVAASLEQGQIDAASPSPIHQGKRDVSWKTTSVTNQTFSLTRK